MNAVPAKKAQANLTALIEQVNRDHEPAVILGGQAGNAVLLSEQDWNAIRETVYLNGVPGLAGQIRDGMTTPLSELAEKPGWD